MRAGGNMLKRQVLAAVDNTYDRKQILASLAVEGYGVTTVHSPADAEKAIRTGTFGLVLADVSAPRMDSLGFLALYRDKNPLGRIIVLSRKPGFHSALQSVKLSACDYMFEPVVQQMLLSAVERAFKDSEKSLARLRAQVAEDNLRLKEELERSNLETIMALANALEARDEYTRGHSFRVSELAIKVGERMGLSPEDMKKLRYGGILHDIGKIGVDSKILNKKTALTKDDFDNIYLHAIIGVKIVSSVESLSGVIPLIQYHHEAYEHLPAMMDKDSRAFLLVCIIKVVDAFDAMVSDRPYRKALPVEMALTELRQYAGKDFHPRVVEEMCKVVRGEIVKKLKAPEASALAEGMGLAFGYM